MHRGWSDDRDLIREFACLLSTKTHEAKDPLTLELLFELRREHDKVLRAFGPECGGCAAAWYTGGNWGEPHEPGICELESYEQVTF